MCETDKFKTRVWKYVDKRTSSQTMTNQQWKSGANFTDKRKWQIVANCLILRYFSKFPISPAFAQEVNEKQKLQIC